MSYNLLYVIFSIKNKTKKMKSNKKYVDFLNIFFILQKNKIFRFKKYIKYIF